MAYWIKQVFLLNLAGKKILFFQVDFLQWHPRVVPGLFVPAGGVRMRSITFSTQAISPASPPRAAARVPSTRRSRSDMIASWPFLCPDGVDSRRSSFA